MNVRAVIVDGPVPLPADDPPRDVGAPRRFAFPPPNAGAVLEFEGLVRPTEGGRAIAALVYEVYEPMAGRMMAALGRELVQRHGLLALVVEHSRGRVEVGRCAFRLRIAAVHRQEGLAALVEFIDRLKRDVPIWKSPVFAEPTTTAPTPP